jgi:hypothetical protein
MQRKITCLMFALMFLLCVSGASATTYESAGTTPTGSYTVALTVDGNGNYGLAYAVVYDGSLDSAMTGTTAGGVSTGQTTEATGKAAFVGTSAVGSGGNTAGTGALTYDGTINTTQTAAANGNAMATQNTNTNGSESKAGSLGSAGNTMGYVYAGVSNGTILAIQEFFTNGTAVAADQTVRLFNPVYDSVEAGVACTHITSGATIASTFANVTGGELTVMQDTNTPDGLSAIAYQEIQIPATADSGFVSASITDRLGNNANAAMGFTSGSLGGTSSPNAIQSIHATGTGIVQGINDFSMDPASGFASTHADSSILNYTINADTYAEILYSGGTPTAYLNGTQSAYAYGILLAATGNQTITAEVEPGQPNFIDYAYANTSCHDNTGDQVVASAILNGNADNGGNLSASQETYGYLFLQDATQNVTIFGSGSANTSAKRLYGIDGGSTHAVFTNGDLNVFQYSNLTGVASVTGANQTGHVNGTNLQTGVEIHIGPSNASASSTVSHGSLTFNETAFSGPLGFNVTAIIDDQFTTTNGDALLMVEAHGLLTQESYQAPYSSFTGTGNLTATAFGRDI